MQETMYMNYKMMTGQFAAAASAASSGHQVPPQMMVGAAGGQAQNYPVPHGYHYHAVGAGTNHEASGVGTCEEDLEPPSEANEADYDEDSESDVEDECDSNVTTTTTRVTPVTSSYNSQQQQAQSQVQQPSSQPSQPSNDEGFIDDPDCDCDARNFSTSESRVPFQYCYHCAPFHPSNGRGPTLVPSPCTGHQSATSSTATVTSTVTSASSMSTSVPLPQLSGSTTTLYDMDSQDSLTEINNRGTKRGRSHSLDSSETVEAVEETTGIILSSAKKKRRESGGGNGTTEECTSPNTSQDESGYQSDSSQHEVCFTFTFYF